MKAFLSWIRKYYKFVLLGLGAIFTIVFIVIVIAKRKNGNKSLSIMEIITEQIQSFITKKEEIIKEHDSTLEDIKKERETLAKEKKELEEKRKKDMDNIENATDEELGNIIEDRNL